MHESAHALLRVGGRYALQLRDDAPSVVGRGLWGLFGGAIEASETPEQALRRELREELDLDMDDCHLFWCFEGVAEEARTPKRWWFFEVDLSARWESHRLHEGQAVALFAFGELHSLPMTPLTREALSRRQRMSREIGGSL